MSRYKIKIKHVSVSKLSVNFEISPFQNFGSI